MEYGARRQGTRWTVRNILLVLGAVWAAVAAVMATVADGDGYELVFTIFVAGDSAEGAERAYRDAILAVDGHYGVMLYVHDFVLTDDCPSAASAMDAYGVECGGVEWVAAAKGGAVSNSMSRLTDAAGALREHAHTLKVWEDFDIAYAYMSIAAGALPVGLVAYAARRGAFERLYAVWLAGASFMVPPLIGLVTIEMMSTNLLHDGLTAAPWS